MIVNSPVLVVNQNYEPLNICRVRRAVVLLLHGRAEVLENGRGNIHSVESIFDVPSVIRLAYYVRRPRRQRKLTKHEVFHRDGHTCQYCGRETRELTLDHVVPRRRGGQHNWENVVSACVPCNRRKAGRTPAEARMPLLSRPRAPRDDGFYVPYHYLCTYTTWQKYVHQ
ncbi:MAG: HNH endonuclease [Chloroflexi bacterium]|nr:HNH endonuclease [Chloroflexota bacterium]MBM3153753.1 HNH endonuclease [Chloroflexota bacterium]MBM3173822.1 HNH endonuclease [Chloroflexota bacterium]MBM3174147.1 HNH endonuclease [Chloroflexota bacterium]MBM4449215.1 HNH endonuclease [Chloroflexota bacterium]